MNLDVNVLGPLVRLVVVTYIFQMTGLRNIEDLADTLHDDNVISLIL